MLKYIFSSICCCFVSLSLAQKVEWEGSLSVTSIFSSEETNPFWFYANSDTQFGAASQFSGFGEVNGKYAISENATLEGGVAYFYRDEVEDEFQRRDLYLQFKNKWLKATVGAKQVVRVFDGLSATNKNFLLSGNARPLPGVIIEANEPIKISNTFGIDWGIAHYDLNESRFVDNVRVHYKRFGVITKINEKHRFKTQIQHFAQWGGTSPVFGKLNGDFEAFVDVFFAKKSTEINVEGEIQNAVGNHLGSFLFEYLLSAKTGEVSIYYEHPFEDGSGIGFSNFPDGVWGVHFEPRKKGAISKVLYEYIDTNDQSASQVSGFDNYFSNNVYRSGWSYNTNIIGMPFILLDPTVEINATTGPILSNRVSVHHLGIKGNIKKVEWTLKTSIASHKGTFANPFEERQSLWHNYISGLYTTKMAGSFKLFVGLDTGTSIDANFGGGLEYSYSF